MAHICLCFAVAGVGTVVLNAWRRLVAAAIEMSCCEAMGLGSGLDTVDMYWRSGSIVWQGCRSGGTGSGQRPDLHKNRWLHVVPMMRGKPGYHKLVLWFLVRPGVSC
jgi:hypothetical protein